MGNHRWFTRTVPALAQYAERALELGAGDGALAQKLGAAGLTTDALDQIPAPPHWLDALPPGGPARWHVGDLRAFRDWGEYPIVVGNLILHHFDAPMLSALGTQLDQHARLLVFNEPLRHLRARLLWALGAPLGGANFVTRHDGRVSIAAGFRDEEIPQALGLSPQRWSWRVTTTFLGAYRIVARRRP